MFLCAEESVSYCSRSETHVPSFAIGDDFFIQKQAHEFSAKASEHFCQIARFIFHSPACLDHDVNISLSLAHIERNDAKRELVRVSRF